MRQVKKGSTNVSVDVYIIDSTDGTPETGVVWNTAGIDLSYRREGAAVVSITEATLAALTTAHSDGGFLHIGNGYYRLDVPDAAFATGAETVSIQGTVTGMIVLPQTIQLVDFDPEDGTRLGLTALPNAAADAAGGLPISDAGGLDLDAKVGALTFTVANQVDANSLAVSGSAASADRLEAWLGGFLTGTVETGGGPTTTVFQTDAAEATDDHFNNMVIVFTGGALLGQARRISDYVGATGTITVEPALTEAPANLDTWIIFPVSVGGIDASGRTNVGRWLDTAVTVSGTTAKPEVDVNSISDDATAANNAELMFDGTGYAGGTTRLQVDVQAIDGDADAAAQLRDNIDTTERFVVDNTSFTATTTAAQVDAVFFGDTAGTLEATNDHYNGRIILFLTGNLQGQATDITDYDGTNKRFTYTATTEAPADNDQFVVL